MNTATNRFRKRFAVIAIVISLAFSLRVSTLLIQQVRASTTYEVKISGFAFIPQNLTINPGDTIIWNNTDPVIHTLWFVFVANGSTYLLSDPIPPDSTWTHTFNDDAELQYYSFDMLWITGFLNITAPPGSDIAVTDMTVCYRQTVIPQNRTRAVNVTVTNEGLTAETFTLTVYWNYTHVINSTTVSLAIGETKVVTLGWYPNQTRYMNYTISAYATPLPGEIDTADNEYIYGTVVIVWPGDVDGNKDVFLFDAVKLLVAYGIKVGNPGYNPNYDIDNDGRIFLYDAVILLSSYGYKEP